MCFGIDWYVHSMHLWVQWKMLTYKKEKNKKSPTYAIVSVGRSLFVIDEM